MSNLIVEFSRRGRSSGNAQAEEEEVKQVRFALASEIQFYEGADEIDAPNLYFSKHEYMAMKVARSRDVRFVYQRFIMASTKENKDDLLEDVDFTGLENVLTQELMQKLAERKKQVSRAVLFEQARQNAEGRREVEKIASAAHRYSKFAQKRAEKIASTNAEQLRDE